MTFSDKKLKEAQEKAERGQRFDERGCEPKKRRLPPCNVPGVKTVGWGRLE